MDRKEILQQVDEFLAKNKEAIIQDIIDVVNIKSVSLPGTDNTPFGADCCKVLDAFLAKAENMGMSVQNHEYYCGTVEIGT